MVVVLLSMSLLSLWLQRDGGRPAGPGQAYYYDLTSGKLFSGPDDAIAPIDAPGGTGKGVRAFVYSCEGCEPDSLVVLKLQAMTLEARRVIVTARTDPKMQDALVDAIQHGVRVAAPPTSGQEPVWLRPESSEAAALAKAIASHCGGQTPQPCLP
jgi:hypothetical protein